MQERAMGLLGKKIGMTQIFAEDNKCIPVTVIEVGPCMVIAKKTTERNEKGRSDGYHALTLAFDDLPAKKDEDGNPRFKVSKPRAGVFAKAGLETPKRFVCELRLPAEVVNQYDIGQQLSLDVLEGVDFVDVRGRTKGRGFQGVMKRYNFGGQRATHGTHEFKRHGGSIGSLTPNWVAKGTKMPGQMGRVQVTTQNLRVVEVDKENNLLLVKGAVPGARNTYLVVQPAIKKLAKARKAKQA